MLVHVVTSAILLHNDITEEQLGYCLVVEPRAVRQTYAALHYYMKS